MQVLKAKEEQDSSFSVCKTHMYANTGDMTLLESPVREYTLM